MKNKPITQTQKKGEYAWMNSQSGMATALLVTILSIFVIFVTAGVYAFKNLQIRIAQCKKNPCKRHKISPNSTATRRELNGYLPNL